MKTFDTKTIEQLKYYVYALLDTDGAPFYIGKGNENRVFAHLSCALAEETVSDKYDKIREIISSGNEVKHLILRHNMTEKVSYEVESALIDFIGYLDFPLTNQMLGHRSIENGLMTSDEVVRKYNADELIYLDDPVIIININKTYERGGGAEGIYKATKESWVVAKHRMRDIKFALSEYKGLIVEVFKIVDWYPVEGLDKNDKKTIRWGFNGVIADEEIKSKYFNMSVKASKKRGSSNPIRYCLNNS